MIEQIWNKIKPDISEGNVREDVVAEGFLYPWNHDKANMNMIEKYISIARPEIVLELGTFEGYGTLKIARAMQKNGGKGVVYTFDVGTHPVNSLGPTYGVPAEDFLVDWEKIEGWESFGKVIKQREKNLSQDFGDIGIVFVEGESIKTLPMILKKFKSFDFCFQDSLHNLEYILKEWKLLRKKMRVGSVIIFDDIVENSPEHLWFVKNESEKFKIIHTKIGHQQLWMEKMYV